MTEKIEYSKQQLIDALIAAYRHLKEEGDWVVKTTNPIDEMVSTTQPQSDLESTVVIPDPGWLLQHPSPLHGSWA